MKEAIYTSYEELPLLLNAETLAKLLGVSKEKLQRWIDAKTAK